MPLRSLGLLALVFVLFSPFQLLEPAWRWRFSNALINGAFLPLPRPALPWA